MAESENEASRSPKKSGPKHKEILQAGYEDTATGVKENLNIPVDTPYESKQIYGKDSFESIQPSPPKYEGSSYSQNDSSHSGQSSFSNALRRLFRSNSEFGDIIKVLASLLDKIRRGHSGYAVQQKNRLDLVVEMLQKLLKDRQQESISTTWVVLYQDHCQKGITLVPLPPIPLTNDRTLQVELFLKGYEAAADSHLSLRCRITKAASSSPTTMRCGRLKVSVIERADPCETIVKEIPLKNGEEMIIPKLIPISTVQDLTLNYLVDGLLYIGITVEEYGATG